MSLNARLMGVDDGRPLSLKKKCKVVVFVVYALGAGALPVQELQDYTDKLIGRLADRLVDSTLKVWSLHHANLDNTMLGKGGYLTLQASNGLSPRLIQPGSTRTALAACAFTHLSFFPASWQAALFPRPVPFRGYWAMDAVPPLKAQRHYGSTATDQDIVRHDGSSATSEDIVRRRDLILGAGITAATTCGGAAQAVRGMKELEDKDEATIALFKTATPSVVYINCFFEAVSPGNRFSPDGEIPQGAGSGLVWDKDGHIVTNFHVIRNSEGAQITLTDEDGTKTDYNAKLRGFDVDKDIAVLKVDAPASKLRPIPLDITKDGLRVGQTALAIGNPFGLDHTLTIGVVSGLGREVPGLSGQPIQNAIQTDAAVNPGNSGGPLLNIKGKMVGMNTAIYSATGSSAGVGFAIPVDTLKQVVTSIIADGRVVRPGIGIVLFDPAKAKPLFKAFGISSGVLILDVPRSSPASKVGLRGTVETQNGIIELGDVITQIDDTAIKEEKELFNVLNSKQVGQEIKLKVLRTDVTPEESSTGAKVDVIKRYEVEVETVLGERPGPMMSSNINPELEGMVPPRAAPPP